MIDVVMICNELLFELVLSFLHLEKRCAIAKGVVVNSLVLECNVTNANIIHEIQYKEFQ